MIAGHATALLQLQFCRSQFARCGSLAQVVELVDTLS